MVTVSYTHLDVYKRQGISRGLKHLRHSQSLLPLFSILLWIVLFDAFLRLQLPIGCRTYAYADDGLLLVSANSRMELEKKTNLQLGVIDNWSRENRLRPSPEETKTMLLKGLLARKPVVKMDGRNLEYVKQLTYCLLYTSRCV